MGSCCHFFIRFISSTSTFQTKRSSKEKRILMTLTYKPMENARSQSPRAQRRHFCDAELQDRQRSLLKEDLTPTADVETYKRITDSDPVAVTEAVQNKPKENVKSFTHGGLNFLLQNIERDKKALALSKTEKKDVDKLLYVSTYQRGFDNRYTNDSLPIDYCPQSKISQSDSLYQASFKRPTICGAPTQRFGKRNVLHHESICKDLKIPDVLYLDHSKKIYTTSYGQDYLQPSAIKEIPSDQILIPPGLLLNGTGRASKYKRWGGNM